MRRIKKRNIILSLLIALALWSFVIYTTDPIRSKVITGVPVETVGSEVLSEKGLAIVKPDELTLDITVKSVRSILGGVTKDDIHVTADVSECVAGDNYVPIKVTFDKDVKTASDMARTIHVKVEKVITEARKIKIEYEEGVDNISAELVGPQVVHVSGPKSLVKNVEHISVRLTSDDISAGNADVVKKLVPVDATGKEVSGVKTERKEIVVHIADFEVKTVPLVVTVQGAPAGGYELVSIDIPEEISLTGNKEALRGVKSVSGGIVDISGLYASTEIPLTINLPDGVVIVADQRTTAKVKIAAVDSNEENEFEVNDVMFSGLEEGYSASTDDKVTVKGAGIIQAKVSVIADLSDLGEGTHKVKVKAKSTDGEKVTVSPKYIIVTISKE